jgi:hypothetical protein
MKYIYPHKTKVRFDYKKAKKFFHCKNCMESFLGSELHESMTPRQYGNYEVSTYDLETPSGESVETVVVWCKRCGKEVWNSYDGI